MKLHQLKPAKGSTKRKKKVGRGNASGHGTYSTRGIKGQKSRSGSSFYPGFEGGKTPLIKSIPKVKGFKSLKVKPEIISIAILDKKFKDGDIVNKKKLKELGIIKSEKLKVKLIKNGKTKKKFTLIIDKASKNAIKAIEDAGGEVKLKNISDKDDKKSNKRKTNKK